MNNNSRQLVVDALNYYEASKNISDEFSGPSIYFHQEAIREQKRNFLSIRHIEMIYATLTSWGMHRMGDPKETKTKLVDFYTFQESILRSKEKFEKLIYLRIENMSLQEYHETINSLRDAYDNLHVSVSNSSIVANSKALAHILPNIIPPIDRQYSIRFFQEDNNDFFTDKGKLKGITLPNDKLEQFKLFCELCCQIKELFDKCNNIKFEVNYLKFSTSLPKIIDNMIMAYIKKVRNDFDEIQEES